MSSPLFYDRPIALNSETHRKLRIRHLDEGLKFSARTNSVLLAGVEFPEACKHLPIVFAKVAGSRALPMAMLGFRDMENLFVDSRGRWIGEYVPAYIRRYPFVLAKADAGQDFTVCIDESYPGFSADEGQRLFHDNGKPTDYLKGVLTFLQDYQKEIERTDQFLQTLAEFGLLTEVTANVSLPGGERYSLAELMMVDEQKLRALPDEKILKLFRSGELAWIYSHLLSLANFPRLLGKAAPVGTAPAEKGAAPVEKDVTLAEKGAAPGKGARKK